MAMKVRKGLKSLLVTLPWVEHMSFARTGEEDIAEGLGRSGRLLTRCALALLLRSDSQLGSYIKMKSHVNHFAWP